MIDTVSQMFLLFKLSNVLLFIGVKYTYLAFYVCKCTIQCHQIHSQCCVTITTTYAKLSYHLQQKLCTHSTPPPLSSPPAPGNHPTFISVNLNTVGTSYRQNHTVLSCCIWLVSLSMMSKRFIHAVPCARLSFLFKAE